MSIQRMGVGERLSATATFERLVFLSGQVPDTAEHDVELQCQQVLGKIDALLKQNGSSKDSILAATIYLKSIARDFDSMNRVWSSWLSPGCAPTRTALQADLARPSVLVEITIIAAKE
ncbi:RidA family protein [Pseudomonas syringae pv. actinidiae]|nr:RidA family protein [Pseudomonas syringae pv. actinidiae]